MKTPLKLTLSLFLVIGLCLPMAAHAKGKGKGGKGNQREAIGDEDVITAVTATSITVAIQHPKATGGKSSDNNSTDGTDGTDTKGKKGSKNSASDQTTRVEAEQAKAEVPKTYQITKFTDIEVNGDSAAGATALRVGMIVDVSADPPLDLGPTNDSDGGVARSIVAHDPNVN